MIPNFERRFFSSTRGQIILLLRYGSRTVDELAEALGLTDNGIRSHLSTLERDGLIEQKGTRPGLGKPAYEYILAPEAEKLFAKPYAQVLGKLLDVLDEELGEEQSEALMRKVGRRMSMGQHLSEEKLRARLESAAEILNRLGGLVEVSEEGGVLALRGYSCPLSAVVPQHSQVCKLVETMLSNMLGMPVQEQCERAAPWRCRFEVAS